jgi:hypothetical protein
MYEVLPSFVDITPLPLLEGPFDALNCCIWVQGKGEKQQSLPYNTLRGSESKVTTDSETSEVFIHKSIVKKKHVF